MANPKSCYYYTCEYGYKSFFSGDTQAFSVSVADCDGGSYLSTTGGTASFTLTSVATGAVAYTADNSYTTDVTSLDFIMDSADTALDPGLYKYSVVFVSAGGNVTTLECCTVWIKQC